MPNWFLTIVQKLSEFVIVTPTQIRIKGWDYTVGKAQDCWEAGRVQQYLCSLSPDPVLPCSSVPCPHALYQARSSAGQHSPQSGPLPLLFASGAESLEGSS